MRHDWLYDMEIYPNLVLLGAKVPGIDKRRSFQLSPLADDRQDMAIWLRDEVDDMIGYNNLFYDSPMLYYFIHNCMKMRGRDAALAMFNYSKKLIKSRFPKRINPIRPQIDLFKINHFDNKAKMTSLKLLEFNLRAENLQELPFPFDKVLEREEIWEVVSYNDNDIDATELVYDETKSEIELRKKMSPIYGIDFTNYNSTKMGEHILISKIVEALGEDVMYNEVPTSSGGIKKVVRNTKRDKIDFEEVVFDYIKFETEPFQKLLKWFKSQTITETKGVFSDIPTEDLKELKGHYAETQWTWDGKKKEYRETSTLKKVTKSNPVEKLKTLNVVYDGFRYDFGVGGIHGCILPGVYESTDTHIIIDIDVASYYPNLGIKNKMYPAHVGIEFCDIYEGIYEERKKYPKKTHKAENLALKLALNGSYGKSNSEYSSLCDPMYTMKTTVNGQLLLCMLSEKLNESIDDATMLQINTDGLTIKIPREAEGKLMEICKEWEELTQLELEYAYYSRMIIKDVNNYIGVYDGTDDVKRKGAAFIHKRQPGELELHKNFSAIITAKALEAYYVDGEEPERFVRNHDDMYDFFLRTKVPKTSRLVLRDYGPDEQILTETVGQNITRYLVTGKYRKNKETKKYEKTGRGKTLIKIMPPIKGKSEEREFNVEESWLCTTMNKLPENLESLKQIVDYDYYIEKIRDVIYMIEYFSK